MTMTTVTETKQHFTTFADLLIATTGHQLTAQEIVNERTYISGNWENISLSDELREEICKTISETLGGQYKTRVKIFRSLYYGRPQHWGLRRVFFREYNGKILCSYCAGQDYPAELQQIRNAIK